MEIPFDTFYTTAVDSWEKGIGLVAKLFDVTQPAAVFGQPIQAEPYTVITASEVSVAMGFGHGFGGGSEGNRDEEATGPETTTATEPEAASGGGGGGGGGGAAMSRPVAVISMGPNGVQVQPVVDATKLGLALFTMLGALVLMRRKMKKAAANLESRA